MFCCSGASFCSLLCSSGVFWCSSLLFLLLLPSFLLVLVGSLRKSLRKSQFWVRPFFIFSSLPLFSLSFLLVRGPSFFQGIFRPALTLDQCWTENTLKNAGGTLKFQKFLWRKSAATNGARRRPPSLPHPPLMFYLSPLLPSPEQHQIYFYFIRSTQESHFGLNVVLRIYLGISSLALPKVRI